jgi:hypothetical protein
MRPPRLALLSLCVLISACAAQRGRPARDGASQLEQRPESFVARVARLRELPERRPTPVLFQDEESFLKSASAKAEKEAILPTPIDQPPVQLSLGLMFAARGAGRPASFGALHRSQMVAFYDEFEHRVHVRRGAGSNEDVPFVVAHELGHALQFQHFRVPEVANVTDEDARLARLSLIEGDAMLVMAALAADEHHVPLSRLLVRMSQGAVEESLKGYTSALAQNPELQRAPPFQRERLIFPYQAGAAFVAAIHRAGGFALVNRLYESPPATTEHILHPEKYLAGEAADPVRAPAAPAGWERIQSGHVGELLLRSMLEVCNERPQAQLAAAGWGGDAFAVLRRGDQGALLFVSAWDSEAEAREFERAMMVTARCWDRAPPATRQIFHHRAEVRRTGRIVMVARGLDAALSRKALAALPELVGVRPALAAPLGPVTIPPLRVAKQAPPPFVRAGQLIAPRLGLQIPLLPGLEPSFDEGDVSFSSTEQNFASLIFAVSDLSFSPRSVEHSFRTFEQAMKKSLEAGQRVSVVTLRAERATPLGVALSRTWQVDGTPLQGRLLLLPMCGGTGTLVIAQGYADEATLALLDRVVAGLRPLPGGTTVCAELDP